MSLSPFQNDGYAGWHAGFVQEQWTRGKLTLQGALRFDLASSWFPEQTLGPSKYFPTQIVFPATKGVDSYKDFTPRLGMAYDVFGNGRTALKANYGKYLEGVGVSTNYANSNPTLRIPTSTGPFGVQGVTRAWTDADGDFVPDCDLNNLGNQDLRASGGDLCGPVSNSRWGQNVLTNQYDPEPAQGLGRASVGLGLRRLGPAAAPAPDVGGGGVSPPLVRGLHRAGQHAGVQRRVRHRSVSPRLSTRRCREAAATWCPDSTTSRRPSSVRSSTT